MTSLTLVRLIKARPQIVFDALVTAEGIAQWWGPDGTQLTFTHSLLHDEESRRSHAEGWSGSLDKLESHFVAGRARIQ